MSEPGTKDDPRIGRVLDERFTIVEHLGEGSTATVYRAEEVGTGQNFAVKLVKTPSYQKKEDRERRIARFRREAKAIGKLKHKNTVRMVHYGETPGGQQYMVLEFLDGKSWADEIRGEGRPAHIDLAEVADIGRHVALAMDEAHGLGILHRDLKPANVVLVPQGARDLVKVVDFGAAAFDPEMIEHKKLTAMGATVGSAPYMSPEQSRSEELTSASDVYSLGIVLYEALTGDVPFSGSFVEVMAQHNFEDPPALVLPGQSGKVVQAWQDLISRMLAKTPAERPSMGDVAMELEKVGEVSAVNAPRASRASAPAVAGDKGSGSPLVWVAAVVVLALAAVGVWLAMK